MVAPLILYGAPAAAAIGTGLWYYLRKKKASSPTSQPRTAADDPTQSAVAAGQQYGCDRGTTDGAAGAIAMADIGSDLAATAAANASGQPAVFLAAAAASYAQCYSDALPASVSTDSTPTSTGEKKSDAVKAAIWTADKIACKAAWLDGCTRGAGFGWKDAAMGYAQNPTPSGSRFSLKAANAAYQYAYIRSYNVAYTARKPMTGVIYAEGESTEIPSDQLSSAISSCNSSSNFETWYTSRTGVSGLSVGSLGGLASSVVGGVVGGASEVVTGVQSVVNGMLDTSVAGYKMRDAAHVAGGGLSGFMVAGVPGAVIGSCMTGAMQNDRVRKMGHVLPTVVAAVTGFVVAGVPGTVAGTLAVVGAHMRHVTSKPAPFGAATIRHVTNDIASGKLSHDRAKTLASALDARGDKHAAAAVRASLAAHDGAAPPGSVAALAKPHARRHPMMRRRTTG